MPEDRYRLIACVSKEDGVRFDKPRWIDIDQWFDRIFEFGGTLVIEWKNSVPGEKPVSMPTSGKVTGLTMDGDKRKYLLFATMRGDHKDRVVAWRHLIDNAEQRMVEIKGNEWDARLVQSDVSIARRVFREAFESGTLSEDSLRNMY